MTEGLEDSLELLSGTKKLDDWLASLVMCWQFDYQLSQNIIYQVSVNFPPHEVTRRSEQEYFSQNKRQLGQARPGRGG